MSEAEFKAGIANIDRMIELHKEYITLLHKLKLGLEQHYEKGKL
jgi:hypothetical protein